MTNNVVIILGEVVAVCIQAVIMFLFPVCSYKLYKQLRIAIYALKHNQRKRKINACVKSLILLGFLVIFGITFNAVDFGLWLY